MVMKRLAFILLLAVTPATAQVALQPRYDVRPHVNEAVVTIQPDTRTLDQKRAEFERACRAMVPDGWHEKARAEWFMSCSDGSRLKP
jgi:hypothetical protein